MDLEGQQNLMKFKKEAIDLKKEFRNQDNRKFFEDNRRKFKLFSGPEDKVYFNNNPTNHYQPVIYVVPADSEHRRDRKHMSAVPQDLG